MKTYIQLMVAAGVSALATTAVAQLTLPVTDNFPPAGPQLAWEDYADVAYTTHQAFSPSAPSGDGQVFNVNDGGGHQCVYLTNDTGNLSDYKITAYIYFPSAANWGRFGIVARAQTTSPEKYRPAGYHYIADSDGNNYLRVCSRDNAGNFTTFFARSADDVSPAPLSPTYTLDAWHKLELEVTGTTIKAEFDDVVIVNATNSEFASGRIGIYNYRDGTSTVSTLVDRITIESTATSDVSDWTLY